MSIYNGYHHVCDVRCVLAAHRKCGRMLLGFGRRAPAPSIYAELGWRRLSVEADCEKARLLGRVLTSNNPVIECIVEATSSAEHSWLRSAVTMVMRLSPQDLTLSRAQWNSLTKKLSQELWSSEAAELANQCLTHSGLNSYKLAKWSCDNKWHVNSFLHDTKVPAPQARAISRLIVGGQDLRGGDPYEEPTATPRNCCLFCLENGRKQAETLVHVVFDCEAYRAIRTRSLLHAYIIERDENLFVFHRDVWTWHQLTMLRQYFVDLIEMRTLRAGGKPRSANRFIQRTVDQLWTDPDINGATD